LRRARAEAIRFGATVIPEEVLSVTPLDKGFEVRTAHGVHRAHKVLMATGVRDRIPQLPGFAACYGESVFHCPYCDGWEVRDRALAAFGPLEQTAPLALKLRSWSERVTLFTEGPARLNAKQVAVLETAHISVRSEGVVGLIHTAERLQAVELGTGERVPCDALFFGHGHEAASTLTADMGCAHLETGVVVTDRRQRTRIPGLFVAGDAAINTHFVSVACAEGAKAAVAIHDELLEERGRSWPG
jgi:thioredoxin reductase